MNIQLHEITVGELVEGYADDGEGGVRGYGGRLDIRPPYQREFVYGDRERKAVIDTVMQGFPLNVMYWSARGDGSYEIIDGQQRTISIARYFKSDFSVQGLYFHNQPLDIQRRVLDYRLMVYFCSGTDSEKLAWYQTINIAGVVLTEQELRNAVYSGPWVTDAKRYFSRRGGPAYQVGGDYLRGNAIRQEYLETAIRWVSESSIEDHMALHQHDDSAAPLWQYFNAVMDWVQATFTVYRKSMKGVDWGGLYKDHGDKPLDPAAIEAETARLVLDDHVTSHKGIYPYILTRDEKHLNIRAFDAGMKQRVYEAQKCICPICKEKFELSGMEADHITPWSEGGKTEENNCQMLCRKCNREKSSN
ncbi:MAG: DUF262 domain-containing protein [Anaerolineaceae bacterium]|nr:DUF262 domain-containing protein [Anaerolineaceae bacterium]MDE0329088.1 DUF262 domain-containing protein [Anaerolineaceae bacterium]